ncbi:MAG: MarR family transcriptional regulator [Bifidobacteriaceae bacterium]|nr:MarR family transcriptional regulator [Bifidobacteriaceae bacterium]
MSLHQDNPPAGTVGAAGPVEDATARLVAAWRRERPDLDASPLEVLSRVTRLAKHLDRVRRAVFQRYHLQHWEFDVLTDLRRSGPPFELTPGQMIAEQLVSSGTMTNRIDRMVQAGLVTRHADAADGRVVRVRLTAAGLALIDQVIEDFLAGEAELLAPLTPAQRDQLAAHLLRLLEPFEAHPAASAAPLVTGQGG